MPLSTSLSVRMTPAVAAVSQDSFAGSRGQTVTLQTSRFADTLASCVIPASSKLETFLTSGPDDWFVSPCFIPAILPESEMWITLRPHSGWIIVCIDWLSSCISFTASSLFHLLQLAKPFLTCQNYYCGINFLARAPALTALGTVACFSQDYLSNLHDFTAHFCPNLPYLFSAAPHALPPCQLHRQEWRYLGQRSDASLHILSRADLLLAR